MKNRTAIVFIAICLMIFFAGCSAKIKGLTELDSLASMSQSKDYLNALVFKAEGYDARKFARFMIDDVEIYKKPDADFGSKQKTS